MNAARRLALALIAVLAAGAAWADAAPSHVAGPPLLAQASGGLVWCHEPGRDLVRQMRPLRCKGRIVDEDEARALRRARIERTRRNLEGPKPPVPGLKRAGSGGGTVVSRDGHVLTNHHVVARCTAVSVVPFGAKEVVARIVAHDARADLALLQAGIAARTVARFGPEAGPRPGDPVAAVGFPNLGKVVLEPVLATGHVFIGGDAGRADRYVLKADVRPGNSGGPVLDRSARVIGVVVARLDTPAFYARTGKLLRDVGVAIRPDTAMAFLRSHSVAPVTGGSGEAPDDAALLRRARGFVVRIGCWR